MREWIVSGALTVGDPLPTEAELAERFGTSRSTVREALRLLSADTFISTRPGAGGGSSIGSPSPGRVTDVLQITLGLLVGTSELSLDELLAAREMMEIPAATLAAVNRQDHHVATLRSLLPTHPGEMDLEQLLLVDRAFHDTLLAASGNRLLPLIAAPVYQVVARRLERSRAAPEFWNLIVDQHRMILQAVDSRDKFAAAARMSEHLQELRRAYRLMDAMTKDSLPNPMADRPLETNEP